MEQQEPKWKADFRIRYRSFYYKDEMENHILWIEEYVLPSYLKKIDDLEKENQELKDLIQKGDPLNCST